MRFLRSWSIGLTRAWLPSRRSTLHQMGAWVMTVPGQVRSGRSMGAKVRYFSMGIRPGACGAGQATGAGVSGSGAGAGVDSLMVWFLRKRKSPPSFPGAGFVTVRSAQHYVPADPLRVPVRASRARCVFIARMLGPPTPPVNHP